MCYREDLDYLLKQKYWERGKLWNQADDIIDYPLTIIQAGLGYGKTSYILNYLNKKHQDDYLILDLDKDDKKIKIFLRHLLKYLPIEVEIGLKNINRIKDSMDVKKAVKLFFKGIKLDSNTHKILVLDSFENVSESKEILNFIRIFIEMAPRNFHLVLLSQYNLVTLEWAKLFVEQRVKQIGQEYFTLSSEEIGEFLKFKYDLSLTIEELEYIREETEGWILAITIIGLSLVDNRNNNKQLRTSKYDILFDKYMNDEIFKKLENETAEFILKISILPEIRPEICEQLLNINNSKEIVNKLVGRNIMLETTTSENLYKFNNLFRKFLLKKAKNKYNLKSLYYKAAVFYDKYNNKFESIYHYTYAEEYKTAAEYMFRYGRKLPESISVLIGEHLRDLPENHINNNPFIILLQGQIYFLQGLHSQAISKFTKFKNCYQDKNKDQYIILSVNAILLLLYKNTMQFGEIDSCTNEIVELLLIENADNNKNSNDNDIVNIELPYQHDTCSGLILDYLINKLYREGNFKEIESLLNKIPAKDIKDSFLYYIIKLAYHKVYYMKCDMEKLRETIEEINDIANSYCSPLSDSLTKLRKGYTFLWFGEGKLDINRKLFIDSYEEFSKMNLLWHQVESILGIVLLETYHGDLHKGIEYANKGLGIGVKASDSWSEMIFRLCLGINYYYYIKNDLAIEFLNEALEYFTTNKVYYYQAVCLMWLSLIFYYTNDKQQFKLTFNKLVSLTKNKKMDYVYTEPHLFFKKNYQFVPVLLYAKENGIQTEYVNKLLNLMDIINESNYHPGYKIYIKCFGNLEVFCGGDSITELLWSKERIKDILLFLFLHRGKYISKGEISCLLWRDMEEERASENFKVNLSMLKKIIEPNRKNQQNSFFIKRRGCNYSLNDCLIDSDVDEFLSLIKSGKSLKGRDKYSFYESAINLYKDNYLTDHLYVDWLMDERENLKTIYLKTADSLIKYYYESVKYDKCISLCKKVIKLYNCWENAYLYMIKSYKRLNHRGMVMRIYDQCKYNLERHMDITPMFDIQNEYEEVRTKNVLK